MKPAEPFDLLLFDGRHLLWRAASAFWELHIVDGDGSKVDTGGVYGFLRVALATKMRFGGAAVVAWDCNEGPTFRRALFKGYKNKAAMPKLVTPKSACSGCGKNVSKKRDGFPKAHQLDDGSWCGRGNSLATEYDQAATARVERGLTRESVLSQEAILKEILATMGVRQTDAPGWEADDVIATYCAKLKNTRIGIVSGDRDLLQLVNERVVLIRPMPKGDFKLETPETVTAEHNVTPVQIWDLKALAGDPGDNIPGARGVGPRSAAQLINAWGGWEQALQASIEGKHGISALKKLAPQADNIRLSAALAALNRSAPLFHIPTVSNGRAAMLRLTQLGMNSLLSDGRHAALMAMGGVDG